MNRSIRTSRLLAAVILVACVSLTLPAVALAPAVAVSFTSGGEAAAVVVNLASGVDAAAVAASAGVEADVVFEGEPNGFAARLTSAQLARLRRVASVTSIVPDPIVARISQLGLGQPEQPPQVIRSAQRRVGLLESATADVDGKNDRPINVDIAIFDTGIDKHPDLKVVGGVDCAPGLGHGDREGHGTLVAGLAGAIDNKIGIAGIAPGARLWSVAIGDADGIIRDSWFRCGLEWLNRNAKTIEVANFSFGGGDPMVGPCGVVNGKVVDRLHNLTCKAVRAGVTIVAAAGNDAEDSGLISPAGWPEVITVSATAETDGIPGGHGPLPCLEGELDDHLATFSNFGPAVDIAAPGVCVTSTYLDGQYAFGSGTSLSTPFVSGAAALVMARQTSASPEAVRSMLLHAAEPGPIVGDPDEFPEGLLDVSSF